MQDFSKGLILISISMLVLGTTTVIPDKDKPVWNNGFSMLLGAGLTLITPVKNKPGDKATTIVGDDDP